MPHIQADDIKHSYYSTAIKKLIQWQAPERDQMGRKNPNFGVNPITESLKDKEVIVANQFIELIKAEGADALKRNFNERPLADAPELNAILQDKGRHTLFHFEARNVLNGLAEKLVRELNPTAKTIPDKPLGGTSPTPMMLNDLPDTTSPDAIDRIIDTMHGEPLKIVKNKLTRLSDREAFASFKAADGTVGIDRLIYAKISAAGITEPDAVATLANTLATQLMAAYLDHPILASRKTHKHKAEKQIIDTIPDPDNVVFTLPAKTDPLYGVFPDGIFQDRGRKQGEPQGPTIELEDGGQGTRKIYRAVLEQTVKDFNFDKAIAAIASPQQSALPEIHASPAPVPSADTLIQWAFQQDNAEWIAGILKADQAPYRPNNAPKQNYANANINSVFQEYKAKIERNPEALEQLAERYSKTDLSAPSPVIVAAEKMGVIEPALPRCLTS